MHSKNSAALDYSLLHMVSELDKTEEIMRHCGQLLGTFDAMADNHLLVHKAAFDDVGATADGSVMSSVISAAQASALSSAAAAKSRKAPSQRTGSTSPISAVPSVLGSVKSATGNSSPYRRQKIPVPSRGDVLSSWMQDHGIEVTKAYNASNLERSMEGLPSKRRPVPDPTLADPGGESKIVTDGEL